MLSKKNPATPVELISDDEDVHEGRKRTELPDQADPVVPYADVVRKPGPTITEGEITLHTRMAHRLFYGRRADKKTRVEPIIGLVRFVTNTNGICKAAELNDPYADARLLEIEEAMLKAQHALGNHLASIRDMLDPGESRRVKVKVLRSAEPATFTLNFQYTYGYQGADLLGQYDELVNSALSAKHLGRLFDEDWTRIIHHSSRLLRHVFSLSSNFRFSGARRDDFAANNERARSAIEKYGELPPDVLAGHRRPKWAPPARNLNTKDTK